jgi:hypothetical protein
LLLEQMLNCISKKVSIIINIINCSDCECSTKFFHLCYIGIMH